MAVQAFRARLAMEYSVRVDCVGRIATLASVGLMMFSLAAAASGSTNDDPLAVDAPCSGPASTPVCAMRTWDRCYEKRDAALCALIGIPGVRVELMDDY